MRDIFRGDLVSAEKALSCLAYKNRFDNDFIQPFINKYKNKKFYTYRCYVNDKGSLILERNWFKYYLRDEVFNRTLSEAKKRLGWTSEEKEPQLNLVYEPLNGARRVDKRKLAQQRYERLLQAINLRRYDPIPYNIENIYIKNEKIVIKSCDEIYYICNKKIRRVNFKKLDSDFKVRIANIIINPFDFVNSFNYITNDIYTDICRQDAIMDYQNNPLYSDWEIGDIERHHSYKNYMPLTKRQIEDYKKTITSYFPLLNYMNVLIRNNVLNSFTQESELPNYLKKKIATNYMVPELYRGELEFIVKDENPVINAYDNYDILDSYSLCKNLKLKDINVIKKFIDARIGLSDIPFKEVKVYFKYLKDYYEGKVKNVELLLFNRITEATEDASRTAYTIHGNRCKVDKLSINYAVKDALRMFKTAVNLRKYVKDKPFKKLDMTYLVKNSLKDVHDTLSQISRDDIAVLNYKNFDEVNDYEKYEKEVGSQKFLMPRNSCELIRLADIMRNCVASYQNNIMRKSSIIVYATNNDEIINYIRNGEGDLKDLTNKLEADKIPSPACIEIAERATYAWDYLNNESTTDKTKELKVIQCYGRHNRKLSTLNNSLATACYTYFGDVKVRTISNI